MPILSNQEILRYSRHLIMPEFGMEGQEKLKKSAMLVIGAGGLGSPVTLYLAAAGVGKLGLVDFDVVDVSNLQRQVIHNNSSVGKPKVESAKERVAEINPHVEVVTYNHALTRDNMMDILKDYDLVIGCTDNFPTRYLLNDAAVLQGKVNIYGSIFRFDGQCTVFEPKKGPCYRCLYPEPPPPGVVPLGGVLGILPGVVGLVQATEAVKQVVGIGRSLVGRLWQYDALEMTFKDYKVKRDKNCPVCGDKPTVTELIDYDQFCASAHGNGKSNGKDIKTIDVNTLKKWMDEKKLFHLVDVREEVEWSICRIDGAKQIPLNKLLAQATQLKGGQGIVLQCRDGKRSVEAYRLLEGQGFKELYNLEGGIRKWAEEIDRAMPVY